MYPALIDGAPYTQKSPFLLGNVLFALAVLSACSHPKTVPDGSEAANGNDASRAAAEAHDADAKEDGGLLATDPFGAPHVADRVMCSGIAGKHLADRDLRTSFVEGDDLLALVNRSPTGALAPSFAPSDLVELRSGKSMTARDCDKTLCLRKEAASALEDLMREMKQRGFAGKVESAFRSYAAQCGTFLHWAAQGSFCDATEQSALPGHSQHQLGTTLDMFTEAWAKDARGVFREGFGCTPGGKFLQEHAWDFGFVMPYPIHPDDRHSKRSCITRVDIPVFINPKTGYRYEHWHIRYIGKDAAARFKKAFEASGRDTPNELTVEQWLRKERGLDGPDTELPVCDGCNCGACATLASPGESTCDKKRANRAGTTPPALFLDEHGRPLPAAGAPVLKGAKIGRLRTRRDGVRASMIEVTIDVPEHVLTQPPIFGPGVETYVQDATFETFAPYPATSPRAYAPLAGTWMIGLEPVPNETALAWPWRAGIAAPARSLIYNRANVALPAVTGTVTMTIPVTEITPQIRIVLLEAGIPRGEPVVVDTRPQ
ncbi:MAG: M15 family metallopeptidase [Polyangiaceae bacterium]|nr:M15 family metallopeptidase [Polyangiaceae bacterium]